jgi:hypothetical protein
MTTIGQELRQAVTHLLRRLDFGHRVKLTTRGRDTEDRTGRGRGEENRGVAVPGAAAAEWRVRQDRGRSPVDVDPLELAIREEPNRATVRRPKRETAVSVPANGFAESELSVRSHNRDRASEVATNTIFCPSGEIASDTRSVVGGVAMSTRISAAGAGGRDAHTAHTTAISATNPMAASQTIRSRLRAAPGVTLPST